jgi:hypothetical protein
MTIIGLCPTSGFSTTPAAKKSGPAFQYDLSNFKSDLTLPLTVRDRTIGLPKRNIETRLRKYSLDNRVEPLQLTVDGHEDKIMSLASSVARSDQKLAFANFLKVNFTHGEEIPGTDLRLVTIDDKAINMINQDALSALFSKSHHEVSINTSRLSKDTTARDRLLGQLTPFLQPDEMINIRRKILNKSPLSMDKDLMPQFARQRVGLHTIYKGPNCFHAALSFQSPLIASSNLINVRLEPGYHRDMINYDELWRILQLSFYEIDPARSQLQYGDMIVFFETKATNEPAVDFKNLRHAATYLTGGYVFAKGSKSANSPYLVRTLDEEWETWTKYTDKLGAKVFRRNLKHVSNPLPADPVDWVY